MDCNTLLTDVRFLPMVVLLMPLSGQAGEDERSGEEIFSRHCAPCHAPGLNHPGTLQLSLTRGESNAVLEERDNLAGSYVRTTVRQGLNAMPGFKPTIITEAELDGLADYLSE